jgi:glycerol-3-phosphate O-acyltransferase
VVGQQYKTARLVPEEVLASSRFHERAKQLAHELGRSEQSVLEEAAAYLKEMEAMHNAFAVDAWESFTNRVISSYAIESDEHQIQNLRRLGGEHALVYLPSHRSYLDPFILRSVFHRHGLAPNYVLGGINTGFWPVGPVARRNGIVFIRRSYQDKPVYSATLREYIGYLVRKRFNLEWYIEGGRSRTGKLRPPRYGILAYVIGAVRNGAADDVLLVPAASAIQPRDADVGTWLTRRVRVAAGHTAEVRVQLAPRGPGSGPPAVVTGAARTVNEGVSAVRRLLERLGR